MFIVNVVVIGILAALSVIDIKKHSIGIKTIAVLGSISVFYGGYQLAVCGMERRGIIGTVLFGSLLLFFSLGMKALGMGDIAVLLMLICVKGLLFGIRVFIGAITLMAISLIFMAGAKKITRKSKIAFIPYICASSLGVILCA